MATRKKRDTQAASDVTRAYTVVVEEMRSHFKVFGEKLASLDDKVTSLDEKVTSLDEKFTGKFDSLDLRLERVEHEVGLVKVAVLETRQELKKKVDREEVEAIAERVVTRMVRR